MRYNEAVFKTRGCAMIALALAFWVVVVAAEWALPVTDVTPAHGPHALPAHALRAAGFIENAVVIEHPHIDGASTPLPPDTLAAAVLPRASTSLVALGLIAGLVAGALLWSRMIFAAVRGPPRPLSTVLSGRLMLTRFCIARR